MDININSEITLEIAKQIIEEYPDKNEFINQHYSYFSTMQGEYDDDSLDWSEYWDKCKNLANKN